MQENSERDEKIRIGCLKLDQKWSDAASNAGIGGYSHIRGLEHVSSNPQSSHSGGGSTSSDMDLNSLKEQIESEIFVPSSPLTFDDVIGLEEPKRLLNEAILLPKLVPEFFQGVRSPWKGL